MKQLIVDCVIVGARVSNDVVQKIVNAVTDTANDMIQKRINTEEVKCPGFKCKITTRFTKIKRSGVDGYLFEVKVTYRRRSFSMRLVIKPFKIDGVMTHLVWRKKSDEVLSIDGSWANEFLRREGQPA